MESLIPWKEDGWIGPLACEWDSMPACALAVPVNKFINDNLQCAIMRSSLSLQ